MQSKTPLTPLSPGIPPKLRELVGRLDPICTLAGYTFYQNDAWTIDMVGKDGLVLAEIVIATVDGKDRAFVTDRNPSRNVWAPIIDRLGIPVTFLPAT